MVLWDKDSEGVDTEIQEFLKEGEGNEAQLAPYDILGNLAHTQMLQEQGYLEKEELEEIHTALLELYEEGVELGQAEDIHTAIEERVTEKTEAGKKMHTGRSRNDQVVLDERLYLKDTLIQLALATAELAEALADLGEETDLLLPGYTHYQQAMPTTAENWLGSHAEALLDSMQVLETAYELADRNPLGAAAGYGTSLDIDRERTAELLGFSDVQQNPTHAVASRSTVGMAALDACNHVMTALSTVANDLLLLSTEEFGFVEIPQDYCTGSSIMPQKTNPDVLELVEGKAAEIAGNHATVQQVAAKTPSGYTKTTQITKEALMDGLETAMATVNIMTGLVEGLSFNEETIEESIDESIYAAHTANTKVEEGTPFREAYHQVKSEQSYRIPSPEDIPSTAISTDHISEQKSKWTEKETEMEQTVSSLLELAEKNSG